MAVEVPTARAYAVHCTYTHTHTHTHWWPRVKRLANT
jgi:hypothetical protein